MSEADLLPGQEAAGERSLPLDALSLHERAELVPPLTGREYAALVADLRERGRLTTPLEATATGVLLDGRARLEAARELGYERVPVRIVTPEDETEHIILSALRRRQLTDSQRAALALELSAYREAKDAGKARRLANLRRSLAPEVATLPPRGEKTRDIAARLAGVSARTVQDAAAVKEADRELFQAVRAGEIPAHRAAQKVRRALRDAALPAAPPLPQDRFQLLYADPPWQLGNPDGDFAPENHYPTLPLAKIEALCPPTSEDAVLFLWAVNSLLPEALQVMTAWGFTYKTNLAWVKRSIGLGVWARNRHELLLVGVRGTLAPPDEPDRPDSVIEAPRGRHSEKPQEVYERIERAYPRASKLELFARGARPGWTAWGNETPA